MCNFAVQINGYRKMTAHRRSNNLTQLIPPHFKFKTFLSWMLKPVREEWPFILLASLMTGSSGYWLVKTFESEVPYLQSWLVRFGNGIAIAYCLSWLMLTVPKGKWRGVARGLLTGMLSVLFLVEGYAFGKWGMHISPTLMVMASETNTREVCNITQMLLCAKIFRQITFAYLAIMALFGLAQYYRKRINRIITSHTATRLLADTSIFIALSLGIIGGGGNMFFVIKMLQSATHLELQYFVGTHNQFPEWSDNVTRLLFSCQSAALVSHDISEWEQLQTDFLENGTATSSASDSLQIVCIIGESFIRNHSSMYGYPLDTNPRLSRELRHGNLVTFTDMMSPFHNTSASVRAIVSLNHDGIGESWGSTVSLPAVFKKAGYNVYALDNQQTGNSSIYSFALGRMLFNPVLTQRCYDIADYKNRWQSDLTFVEETEQMDMPLNRKALTIYHLAAQHLWPDIPDSPQWKRFTPNEIPVSGRPWLTDEMKQRIADYDNATFYNDSVVTRIIQRYRHADAVVVYFPDHGEEIYDYRPEAHRPLPMAGHEREYLDHINAIPLFVWMSDSFISNNPSAAEAIRNASKLPGTLADISHALVGLGRISTPTYDPTRDILSPEYVTRPRITSRKLLFDAPQATIQH